MEQARLIDVPAAPPKPAPEWDGVQPWDYKIPWPSTTIIFEPCGFARSVYVYMLERPDFELGTLCPWSDVDHSHDGDNWATVRD